MRRYYGTGSWCEESRGAAPGTQKRAFSRRPIRSGPSYRLFAARLHTIVTIVTTAIGVTQAVGRARSSRPGTNCLPNMREHGALQLALLPQLWHEIALKRRHCML